METAASKPLSQLADDGDEADITLKQSLNLRSASLADFQRHLASSDGEASRKTRRLSLQSPAVPTGHCVGRLEFPSSPAPDLAPSPMLPLSPFSPTSKSRSMRTLDGDNPAFDPRKKLNWCTQQACDAPPSASLPPERIAAAERIWSTFKSGEKDKAKAMFLCGLRALLERRSVQLARQCLVYCLMKWRTDGGEPKLHDLARLWCFRLIWRPSIDRISSPQLNLVLRDDAADFAEWFMAEVQRDVSSEGVESPQRSRWSQLCSFATSDRRHFSGESLRKLQILLLDIFEDDVDIRNEVACSYLIQGNLAEAGSLFRDILRLDKTNATVLNNFAVFLMKKNDFATAVSVLKSSLDLDASMVPCVIRTQFQCNLYVALVCAGEWSSAQIALQKAERLAGPEQVLILQFNVASCLVSSLSQIMDTGARVKACAAARNLLEAILERRRSDAAYTAMGKLLAHEASFEEDAAKVNELRLSAAENFVQAIRLAPNHPVPWNEFGRLALAEMDFEKAERIFNSVLRKHPQHVGVLCNYGIALHLGQKLDEAEAVYKRIITIDSNCVCAWNNLGSLYRDSGQLQLALDALQRCLELMPDSVSALCNLALLHIRMERFADADALLVKALAIEPHNDVAQSNLLKVRQLRRRSSR